MKVCLKKSEISGAVTPPASKSMAHRALICAALASGESVLKGVSISKDILATIGGLRQIGAKIQIDGDTVQVIGTGNTINSPKNIIDCNESGSTLRFFIPLFSMCNSKVEFTGASTLLSRPQGVYQTLFDANHVEFIQDVDKICVNGALDAGNYTMRGDVSSQFITGLLYALALCGDDSTIQITEPFESRSYVELTIEAMADFGVEVLWEDQNTLSIKGGQKFTAQNYRVEADWSQTAFWAVLGAVKGHLTIKGVRQESKQGDKVILDILKRCGANFVIEKDSISFQSASLKAVEIDLADCPDLGPILMVLALFCQGETIIRNAGRLRVKESDRIAAMQAECAKMGGTIQCVEDTLYIKNTNIVGVDTLESHNDHRIVMSMCVAALCSDNQITMENAQAVQKSYPKFFEDLEEIGGKLSCDYAEH